MGRPSRRTDAELAQLARRDARALVLGVISFAIALASIVAVFAVDLLPVRIGPIYGEAIFSTAAAYLLGPHRDALRARSLTSPASRG